MSREIKFRAWTHQNPQMPWLSKNIAITGDGEQMVPIGGTFTGVWHVLGDDAEGLVIEQYTGLKDKNGKEIYEGDIMEFGIAGAENRGVVGYEEDFGSYETYTSKGYIIAPLFTSRGKVIGNIHENPELLGGENE